jgi:hypothetical protein
MPEFVFHLLAESDLGALDQSHVERVVDAIRNALRGVSVDGFSTEVSLGGSSILTGVPPEGLVATLSGTKPEIGDLDCVATKNVDIDMGRPPIKIEIGAEQVSIAIVRVFS